MGHNRGPLELRELVSFHGVGECADMAGVVPSSRRLSPADRSADLSGNHSEGGPEMLQSVGLVSMAGPTRIEQVTSACEDATGSACVRNVSS